MDVGAAFITDAQSPEAVELAQGALDDPGSTATQPNHSTSQDPGLFTTGRCGRPAIEGIHICIGYDRLQQ